MENDVSIVDKLKIVSESTTRRPISFTKPELAKIYEFNKKMNRFITLLKISIIFAIILVLPFIIVSDYVPAFFVTVTISSSMFFIALAGIYHFSTKIIKVAHMALDRFFED